MEEALDLSFDRLLLMMILVKFCNKFYKFTSLKVYKKNVIMSFYRKNEISLNQNNFNIYILYHSIYRMVSSIKTYELMMA